MSACILKTSWRFVCNSWSGFTIFVYWRDFIHIRFSWGIRDSNFSQIFTKRRCRFLRHGLWILYNFYSSNYKFISENFHFSFSKELFGFYTTKYNFVITDLIRPCTKHNWKIIKVYAPDVPKVIKFECYPRFTILLVTTWLPRVSMAVCKYKCTNSNLKRRLES